MSQHYKPTLAQCLVSAIFFVIMLLGFVLLSYILIWAALIGFVIFAFLSLKAKFFPEKNQTEPSTERKREPITIDQIYGSND